MNINLKYYEFGKDNRAVTINERKLIYPNISSIKGFGQEGVHEKLYELGQKEYKSF